MNTASLRSSFAVFLAVSLLSSGCYAVYTIPMGAVARYASNAPTRTEEDTEVRLQDALWVQPEGHEEARVGKPVTIAGLQVGIGPATFTLNGRDGQTTIDPHQVRALQAKHGTPGGRAGVIVSASLAGATALTALVVSFVAIIGKGFGGGFGGGAP